MKRGWLNRPDALDVARNHSSASSTASSSVVTDISKLASEDAYSTTALKSAHSEEAATTDRSKLESASLFNLLTVAVAHCHPRRIHQLT